MTERKMIGSIDGIHIANVVIRPKMTKSKTFAHGSFDRAKAIMGNDLASEPKSLRRASKMELIFETR